MELESILKQVELFRGLDDEQLQEIADITHQESHDVGSVIFNQGDDGDKMYIVGSGQVEIKVRHRTGYTYSAVYLGEGQVFGEMALIDESTRSASVISAQENTIVHSITREEFVRLCNKNTATGYLMMRNIAQDLSFKMRHRDFDPSDRA
jgi:CRP/FNR family cyclic AMP-dependent transcriptional regulator